MKPMAKKALVFVLSIGIVVPVACAKPVQQSHVVRPVRTMKVERFDGKQTLTQTGEIQARRETDLSFQLGGRVARRLVEVGTTVSKGQTLAILDSRIATDELRAAEADLANARSAFDLAEMSQARVQKLFAADSVSRQQLDEVTATLRAAAARRDMAEVARDLGRQKLTYARLLAEETGVVVAVGANQGQIVAPGQMIARVATRERDAVFSVSEQVILCASPDIKVHVSLAAKPAIAVTGTVREVSPAADPVTRTYRVRIALPDAPSEMSLGATVIGKVELSAGLSVAVPAAAMTSEDGVPAVYLLEPGSKTIQRRKVTVARIEDGRVFIGAGLDSGQLVVTAGVTKLRPGQLVALSDAEREVP